MKATDPVIASYRPRLHAFIGRLARPAALPIVVILLVAAFLRIDHIKQPFVDAFSWRQSSTAMIADNFYQRDWNIFYPEVSWSGPGPSYQGREFQTVSYLTALLYLLFGQQDWVGRGVAVAFGLWGIFALYQLVRRVWDESRALIAAGVMAVMPGSIFIERSMLPDPAMVALVTTSLWMLVDYLRCQRPRYLLLAGFFGAWGFCTKLPGAIVLLPATYAILSIWGLSTLLRARNLLRLASLAALALGPVIAYYLWARHLALSYPPYHFAGDGNWLWQDGLRSWLDQGYFLPRLRERFVDWLWTMPVIVLVSLGLVVPPDVARHAAGESTESASAGRGARAPWLFHLWIVACAMYYVIGAKELVTNPWNFHIVNPAAAALAANAIAAIARLGPTSLRRPGAIIVAAAALLVIGVSGQLGLQYMYTGYARESYSLGLALRDMTQPDDLVVTMANDFGDPVAIYYSRRRGWVFPPAEQGHAWDRLPDDDAATIRMLEELRAQGAKWLGIVDERKKDFWLSHPKLVEHVKRTCEFKIKADQYVIYRILTPGEVAQLSD